MIKPDKYLNLDLSVLSIGALILNFLKENKYMKYDELLNKIIAIKGLDSKVVFLPALNFLFLLGRIEYHQKSDSININNEVLEKIL